MNKIKKRSRSLAAVLILTTILISGCGIGNEIKIGAQTYTETKLIAAMYQILIEDRTDIRVRTMPDLASTPVVIQAMDRGDVDMATMYTGEIFNNYFPVDQDMKDTEGVLLAAQEGFGEYFNFRWFDPYGFENTYAFTVRQALADEHNLEKISDLESLAGEMRLGVDTGWLERGDDGYRAFSELYGITFGDTYPMEIGLVYEAVANDEVDIVLAYSTDPRLVEFNLATLQDDLQFFPPYDASPVVRQELLDEYPELTSIIELLVGQLDEETITGLNYEVDINQRSERAVAREFLRERGLIE